MDVLRAIAITALAALTIPVLFLVPGVLLQMAYLRGARHHATDQIMLARSIASALLVHALALWGTVWLVADAFERGRIQPIATAVWVLIVLLVAPIVIGSVLQRITRAKRPKWVVSVVDFLGLAHHMRLADAWTSVFSRRQASWVRVHLVDGKVITGYFGSDSDAASDSSRGDLYLQRQHDPNPGKILGPAVPNSSGVWIAGSQIAFVEFFNGKERKRNA
jgi:fumarate reductase subunit D